MANFLLDISGSPAALSPVIQGMLLHVIFGVFLLPVLARYIIQRTANVKVKYGRLIVANCVSLFVSMFIVVPGIVEHFGGFDFYDENFFNSFERSIAIYALLAMYPVILLIELPFSITSVATQGCRKKDNKILPHNE